jgi:hypothetical protein
VRWKKLTATESQEQITVIDWAKANEGYFPQLKRLLAILNGGSRSFRIDKKGRRYSIEGQRLKREGVRSGVPDLFLPIPIGGSHGLWIEMKTETGKLSEDQIDWIRALEQSGFTVRLGRGADHTISIIQNYLKLRNRQR